MKTKIIFISMMSISLISLSFKNFSIQNEKEPWTKQQLMEPADLAKIISDSSAKKPTIFSVGPGGGIPFSVETGDAKEQENLDNLKNKVSMLSKDAAIVIYCGCCPFDKCPNIRPAFKLLNEMKFTNHKLLNLPHNIKVNWIDKGYPMNH